MSLPVSVDIHLGSKIIQTLGTPGVASGDAYVMANARAIHAILNAPVVSTVTGISLAPSSKVLSVHAIRPSVSAEGGSTVTYLYLDGSNGNDSNDGSSWAQAFKTPAHAASAASDNSRIYVAPGIYTISSPISYSGKRIWWEGPLCCADQIQSVTGNASFYASGAPARYFDISDAAGGGFKEIMFSNRPVSSDMIRITNVQNFRMEQVRAHPTNPITNSLVQFKPLLRVSGTSGDDNSGLYFKDCDAHSSALIYAHTAVSVPSRQWQILRPYDQSDLTQSNAYIDLAGDFDQLYIEGGYLEMTNPAIRVDMSGVSGNRRVTAFLGGFERLVSPYYGAAFYNCDFDEGVYFGGSTYTTGGYVYGDANCTGFVAVPSYRLAGALHPGVN